MSSPQGSPRPCTSSTPTAAELALVDKYSGVGVSRDRKIPVSEAVSREYRVPEEIRILGYNVVNLYVDQRIKKIEVHNLEIRE